MMPCAPALWIVLGAQSAYRAAELAFIQGLCWRATSLRISSSPLRISSRKSATMATGSVSLMEFPISDFRFPISPTRLQSAIGNRQSACLLYTSDAADERSSVDLGGR